MRSQDCRLQTPKYKTESAIEAPPGVDIVDESSKPAAHLKPDHSIEEQLASLTADEPEAERGDKPIASADAEQARMESEDNPLKARSRTHDNIIAVLRSIM